MIIRSMTAPIVAIEGSFYVVHRFPVTDADEHEVELDHVPLGSQPQRSPRRIATPLFEALIATGDAVLVDGGLLDAMARRLARHHAELKAAGRPMKPREGAAYGRVLEKMVTGTLRSAAALIDDDALLEPA